MSEERVTTSSLVSQGRNIGYYAALLYGAGYILAFIGILTLIIIFIIVFLGAAGPLLQYMPSELIASLVIYLIAMVFGIIFGASIIRSAKAVRTSEINLNAVASPVSRFSTMLILYGIGNTILASALKASLVGPICGIIGAVLLLMGFRTYQSGAASESKLMGAILMLVSLILVYFIATPQSILNALSGGYGYAYPSIIPTGFFPVSYLFSEPRLEFIALLLAVIGALMFALRVFGEKMQHAIAGVILSISGLLFSIGVMYINFTSASSISSILGYLSSYAPLLSVLWITVIGMILLGIGGIMALIASIIPLVSTATQLSAQIPAAAPPPPPPPPPS
ncbi:MAG: hypothetical protein QXH40_01060 [Candidatus Bathyarchaeia archaeon]